MGKWMIAGSTATDRTKAIIAGHYVFSKPEFEEIKKKAISELRKGIDLNEELKIEVKKAIMRYMRNFGLVREQKWP